MGNKHFCFGTVLSLNVFVYTVSQLRKDSITQDEMLTSLCEHVQKLLDFLVNIVNLGKLGGKS